MASTTKGDSDNIVVKDFSQMCRCCMDLGIYDMRKISFSDMLVSNMLKNLTAINLTENEDLPCSICRVCLQELILAHKFLVKTVKTQTTVNEMYGMLVNPDKDEENDTNSSEVEIIPVASTSKNKDHCYTTHASITKIPTQFPKITKISNVQTVKNIATPKPQTVVSSVAKHVAQKIVMASQNKKKNLFTKSINVKVEPMETQNDFEQEPKYEDNDVQYEQCQEDELEPPSSTKVKSEQLSSNEATCSTFKNEYYQGEHENTDGREVHAFENLLFDSNSNSNQFLNEDDSMDTVESSDNIVTCEFCGESFEHSIQLLMHQETFHTNNVVNNVPNPIKPRIKTQKFKCPICNKRLADKEALKVHLKSHRKKQGTQEIELKKRFTIDKITNRFTCKICDATFDDIKDLRTHFAENSKTHLNCSVCNQNCSTLGDISVHEADHIGQKGQKPYECEVCGLQFQLKLNLMVHQKLHDGDGILFRCDVCEEGFIKKSDYVTHLSVHSDCQETFQCETCDLSFSSQDSLRRHEDKHFLFGSTQNKTTTDPAKRIPVDCPECGKTCSSAMYLYHHRKAVHGEKTNYECNICGKTYLGKISFDQHMRYHGPRDHVCEVCGKGFPVGTSLKLHKLTHSDERPHVCRICGNGFKQRPHLDAHLRALHNILRSNLPEFYECEICQKRFKHKGDMHTHQMIHDKINCFRFVCTICQNRFPFESRLKKHMLVHSK